MLYPSPSRARSYSTPGWAVEAVSYFRELFLREMIEKHMKADEADLEVQEGQGLLNFLHLDDTPVSAEGEQVDPDSVIALEVSVDLPIIPQFARSAEDPFVRRVLASNRKWVILTDRTNTPLLVLDADAFARSVLLSEQEYDPYRDCHRPVVVTDPEQPIGKIISCLEVDAEHPEDDVVDRDIVLVWSTSERRIITGADLLGRLLRGIVVSKSVVATPPAVHGSRGHLGFRL